MNHDLQHFLNLMEHTTLLYGKKPTGGIDYYLETILEKNSKDYHTMFDLPQKRIIKVRYETICVYSSNDKLGGINIAPLLQKAPCIKTLIVQNRSSYEACRATADKIGIPIVGFNRHMAGLFCNEIDMEHTMPFFYVNLHDIPKDDLLWPDWMKTKED